MAKTPYEQELERLIETELLPKYIKYHTWIGQSVNLSDFPQHLVENLQQRTKLPALLKAKKKSA